MSSCVHVISHNLISTVLTAPWAFKLPINICKIMTLSSSYHSTVNGCRFWLFSDTISQTHYLYIYIDASCLDCFSKLYKGNRTSSKFCQKELVFDLIKDVLWCYDPLNVWFQDILEIWRNEIHVNASVNYTALQDARKHFVASCSPACTWFLLKWPKPQKCW